MGSTAGSSNFLSVITAPYPLATSSLTSTWQPLATPSVITSSPGSMSSYAPPMSYPSPLAPAAILTGHHNPFVDSPPHTFTQLRPMQHHGYPSPISPQAAALFLEQYHRSAFRPVAPSTRHVTESPRPNPMPELTRRLTMPLAEPGHHMGAANDGHTWRLVQLVTNHLISDGGTGRKPSGNSECLVSPAGSAGSTSYEEPLDFTTAGHRRSSFSSHTSSGSAGRYGQDGAVFDGSTVLCQVCGDRASGLHYGVHACEGCKGFFRRSIQQKMPYRPCTKNQQCSVLRINRNRCQYCRLKKCIAVGMSRDAVRFGRVPKKEKQRIMAEMHRANTKSQVNSLHAQLENDERLITSLVAAHQTTCAFTSDRLTQVLTALHSTGVQQLSNTACPLSPGPYDGPLSSDLWHDYSEKYAPAIRGVVDFAKSIPGFHVLPLDDQVTLLKAGVFEVLLLRLAFLFNPSQRCITLLNGATYKRDTPVHGNTASSTRFLVDSLFDFVDRLKGHNLCDSDIAVFSAVVLICPERPGLRNIELVESMHNRLLEILQKLLLTTHPTQTGIYQALLAKLPDLRTLNTLHSEKLNGFRIDYANNTGLAKEKSTTTSGTHHSPGKHSHTTDSGKGSISADSEHSDDHSEASCSPSAKTVAMEVEGAKQCPSLRHKYSTVASLLEQKPTEHSRREHIIVDQKPVVEHCKTRPSVLQQASCKRESPSDDGPLDLSKKTCVW